MCRLRNSQERPAIDREGCAELRSDQGYSQEGFAAECGLHRTYMGGIETGKRNVSLVNIEKIARALKVPIRELFPETPARKKTATRR